MASAGRVQNTTAAPAAGRARSIGLAVSIGLAMFAIGMVTSAEEPGLSEVETNPLDADEVLQARALRGLRPEVAAKALSGQEGGDLSLAVLAMPIPAEAGSGPVPVSVFVEIDGASFLQYQQGDLARLEVYVYALDADRRIVDYLAEAFPVDVAALGERIWQSGLEFFAQIELPPGDYSVRVLVRNYRSKAYGLRVLELQVPDFATEPSFALTPLIAEPIERDLWLPVRSWRGATPASSSYSLDRLGLSLNPAARPVLSVGREVDATLPVFGLEETASELRFELVGSKPGIDGVEAVTESPAEVVGRKGSPLPGVDLLEVRLSIPEVPAGLYRARLRLGGAAGEVGEVVSEDLEVLVVEVETRERNLLWSDLRWLLDADAPADAAASVVPTVPGRPKREQAPETKRAARRASKRALEEISAEYRGVLATMASGTLEAARGELFDLESKAVRGERRENLLAAELAVATELGRRDDAVLVPFVQLHSEMYERYRARRLYLLLAHTRELLEGLVEVYIESGGKPELGGDMLSRLAGVLQDANLISGCRRVFSHSLELDPNNAAALLGLAATFEKYGDYQPALAHLEHLVTVAPELEEAKLRLALVLGRVGLRRRSRELLEELAERGHTDWVQAVAYEEIARLLLQTGAVAAAVDLLEQAVRTMPERQSLRILAAHSYDRLGSPRQALEHLTAVVPATDGVVSERLEYDRWPHGEQDRIDSRLDKLSREAMTALRDAVAADGRRRKATE